MAAHPPPISDDTGYRPRRRHPGSRVPQRCMSVELPDPFLLRSPLSAQIHRPAEPSSRDSRIFHDPGSREGR